jgi:hypothetical protein
MLMANERVDAILYKCSDCRDCDCTVESATRPVVEMAANQFAKPNSVARIETAQECGGISCGVVLGYGFFIDKNNRVVGRFSLGNDELRTMIEFPPFIPTSEIKFDFVEWAQQQSQRILDEAA